MKKLFLASILALPLFMAPDSSSAQYYVKKGDTLTKIARIHGMAYHDLISLNPHIPNPNLIYPNQFIVIRSNKKIQDLIDYARSLQDVTQYVFGGQEAPYRTDCSGWVQHVYQKFGVNLPRSSRTQAAVGTSVPFQQLKKGDLMFFSTRADKVITHVGIYLGNNYWISNLNSRESVEVLSSWGTWTQKYFVSAARVM
jgi:LysM repeat protein